MKRENLILDSFKKLDDREKTLLMGYLDNLLVDQGAAELDRPRRGRPRKVVPEGGEKDSGQVKRGRGRPRNVVPEGGEKDAGVVKRGRGRPRKVKPVVE